MNHVLTAPDTMLKETKTTCIIRKQHQNYWRAVGWEREKLSFKKRHSRSCHGFLKVMLFISAIRNCNCSLGGGPMAYTRTVLSRQIWDRQRCLGAWRGGRMEKGPWEGHRQEPNTTNWPWHKQVSGSTAPKSSHAKKKGTLIHLRATQRLNEHS